MQWGGRLLAVTGALQLEGFPCHPLEPGHLSPLHGCGQITQEPKRTPAQERFLRVRVRVGSPDVFVASEGPSAPSRGAGPRTQAGVQGAGGGGMVRGCAGMWDLIIYFLETLALLQRRIEDAEQ